MKALVRFNSKQVFTHQNLERELESIRSNVVEKKDTLKNPTKSEAAITITKLKDMIDGDAILDNTNDKLFLRIKGKMYEVQLTEVT